MTTTNLHTQSSASLFASSSVGSNPLLGRRSLFKFGAAAVVGTAIAGGVRTLPGTGVKSSGAGAALIDSMVLDPAVGVVRSLNGNMTRVLTPVGPLNDKAVYMVYRRNHAVVSAEGRDLLASRGFTVEASAAVGTAMQHIVPAASPDRRLSKWVSDPLNFWRAAVDADSSFVGHLGVDYLFPLSFHYIFSSAFDPITYTRSAPPQPATPDADAPIVGVIDTGVDLTHPWFGPGVMVDSQAAHESLAAGSRPVGPAGHGTAVCGVIRQVNANRRIAVESVSAGGMVSEQLAADAVLRLAKKGASTIVMPFTGLLAGEVQASSIALSSALAEVDDSVNLVAAAGNNGLTGASDDPFVYPAQMPGVTAVTSAGDPVWANQGDYVDAEAQGIDVVTSYPVGGGSYVRWSGTSFAAPAIAANL